MEDGRMLKHRMGYEAILGAVGKFCDQQKLDEVSLLEFEKGIILQGLRVQSTTEGYIRQMITHTWSFEDISEMSKKKKGKSASG